MTTIPKVGARVMRTYGRREYVDYGEVGTVTAHNSDGTFEMTLDDIQPFHRWMFGAKSKPTDNGGRVHKRLTAREVEPLASVYRRSAARLRSVAKAWDENARAERDREKGVQS